MVIKLNPGCFKQVLLTTNMCAVIMSKQEAGEAVADSNHGDEAKNYGSVGPDKRRSS